MPDLDTKPGVYACLRCKARKIKCDRTMPRCTPCERANDACLTVDPASGRQIPRSYISDLEARLKELETELHTRCRRNQTSGPWIPDTEPGYHGGSSGFSIAADFTTMFKHENASRRDQISSAASTSYRRSEDVESDLVPPDPWHLPLDLPPKTYAEQLIKNYFEKSNVVIPVLHREQFIVEFFEPIYGPISPGLQLCSMYTALRLKRSAAEPGPSTFYRRWADGKGRLSSIPCPKIRTCLYFLYMTFALGSATDQKLADTSPEEGPRYRSAAMYYYPEVAYAEGKPFDREHALQAMLLLATYGVFIPSHPSAWFSVGTAMRMCIDMGLHNESRVRRDAKDSEFLIDLRRRLFWCAYTLDRMVSVYLGRPVNLGEEYIDCPASSIADDSWIPLPDTLEVATVDADHLMEAEPTDVDAGAEIGVAVEEPGSASAALSRTKTLQSAAVGTKFGRAGDRSHIQPEPSPGAEVVLPSPLSASATPPNRPSYKWVSRTITQLRRIQHKVKLQLYDRVGVDDGRDVRDIRDDIATDLEEWYASIPRDKYVFNFDWNLDYFELTYHYTIILLYRSSRGIQKPTEEETCRMMKAATRVLSMYVRLNADAALLYSWATIHNVMHAALSCLYALYRTDSMTCEYDLDAFEDLLRKSVAVVEDLKQRCNSANTAYDTLNNITRVTLEYLRLRRSEPASKRTRRTPSLKGPFPYSPSTLLNQSSTLHGDNQPATFPHSLMPSNQSSETPLAHSTSRTGTLAPSNNGIESQLNSDPFFQDQQQRALAESQSHLQTQPQHVQHLLSGLGPIGDNSDTIVTDKAGHDDHQKSVVDPYAPTAYLSGAHDMTVIGQQAHVDLLQPDMGSRLEQLRQSHEPHQLHQLHQPHASHQPPLSHALPHPMAHDVVPGLVPSDLSDEQYTQYQSYVLDDISQFFEGETFPYPLPDTVFRPPYGA